MFDLTLLTFNALVYFMTNTYMYKLVYTIVRKNFVMFLRPHNVEIWCMNETYNDKTLIQYVVMHATLPSPYLGMCDCRIYCKTKQTACISYYLHRYTISAHTIEYVISGTVEYFQLTQVRKQVYFLIVILHIRAFTLEQDMCFLSLDMLKVIDIFLHVVFV